MPGKKSDPVKVERLVVILSAELPDATVTWRQKGRFGDVEFLIQREDGEKNILFLSEVWFRDDQCGPAERAWAIHKAAQRLRYHPGENYLLELCCTELRHYEPDESN